MKSLLFITSVAALGTRTQMGALTGDDVAKAIKIDEVSFSVPPTKEEFKKFAQAYKDAAVRIGTLAAEEIKEADAGSDTGLKAVIDAANGNKKKADAEVKHLQGLIDNKETKKEDLAMAKKSAKALGVGLENVQYQLIAVGEKMNRKKFKADVLEPMKEIDELKKLSGGSNKVILWIILAIVGVAVVGAAAFFLLRKK